jgi:hypothetical protein
VQVCVDPRVGGRVAGVEGEERLVEAHRGEFGRPRVGGIRAPGDELGGRGEAGAVAVEVEGGLRAREGLLGGGVEGERLVDHEVVEGGARSAGRSPGWRNP